jgi:RNA polymerase sigma-70 factor (ECF subfamily)
VTERTGGTDPAEAPAGRSAAAGSDEADLELERVLVERARAGDREAFRALYERNVRVVHGFLANRVGPDEAEDLAAETFARAYERLDRFEWRGIPLRAWLLRIAYHEIVSRSRRRGPAEVLTDEPDPGAGTGHATAPGPEDLVVDHHTRQGDVLDALAGLPAAQRAVVELRYLRDLSVAETAEVLELSTEAVRSLTYRSLRNLRERV